MADADSQDTAASDALFAGDHGALPLDTRLALCKLLTGPFIDLDSPFWPSVLRDEAMLRSRLSDVFLELILDRERQVAFTRQADTGDLATPVLLRSTPLTFIDSVLLLHLRQILVDAETRDQRAVVDESDLQDHLAIYATGAGNDKVGASKRIGAAIEKMKKNNILQSIRSADKRYEVSPTLRLLFSANDVETLGETYRTIASGETVKDAQGDVHDQG